MAKEAIYLTTLLMALVTALTRLIPIGFLSGRKLPGWVEAWLRQIPVAILAAMLAPELLLNNGVVRLTHNLYLFASLPTLLVAIKTKNIFWTVLAGVTSLAVLRFLNLGT